MLADWHAENVGRFREPDTYAIFQLFFDMDRRDDVVGDALSALPPLSLAEDMLEDLTSYVNNSSKGRYYSSFDETELRKMFSSGFVEHVFLLEPGIWHGPVFSGYGVHLVFVHDVVKPRVPALEAIREEIQKAWMLEHIDELSALFIDDLISRCEVVVEDLPVAMTAPPSVAEE